MIDIDDAASAAIASNLLLFNIFSLFYVKKPARRQACVKAHGHIQFCLLELHVARRIVRIGHGLAYCQMANLIYGRRPFRCAVMCLVLAGYDDALLKKPARRLVTCECFATQKSTSGTHQQALAAHL